MDESITARLDAQEALLLCLLRDCAGELQRFGSTLDLSPAARTEYERLTELAVLLEVKSR